MFQKTSIKTTEQMDVNNFPDYYDYQETKTEIYQISNIKSTDDMHVHDSSEYYNFYLKPERRVSDINISSEYYYYYPKAETDNDEKDTTTESTTKQTLTDASTHSHTSKDRHVYIYARLSSTLRNRHVFYVRYHYGWQCTYFAHKRCKDICIQFFNQLCRQVDACIGSSTYKYKNFCKVMCNVRFFRPDLNKKLFRTPRKTRRRRSNKRNRYLRQKGKEYKGEDKNAYKEEKHRGWKPMHKFMAAEEE